VMLTERGGQEIPDAALAGAASRRARTVAPASTIAIIPSPGRDRGARARMPIHSSMRLTGD